MNIELRVMQIGMAVAGVVIGGAAVHMYPMPAHAPTETSMNRFYSAAQKLEKQTEDALPYTRKTIEHVHEMHYKVNGLERLENKLYKVTTKDPKDITDSDYEDLSIFSKVIPTSNVSQWQHSHFQKGLLLMGGISLASIYAFMNFPARKEEELSIVTESKEAYSSEEVTSQDQEYQ